MNMENSDIAKWRHQGNRYGVGSSPDGKEIRIMGLMPVFRAGQSPETAMAERKGLPLWPLTLGRESALELAAWIVAVSAPEAGEFERILDYVRGKPVA